VGTRTKNLFSGNPQQDQSMVKIRRLMRSQERKASQRRQDSYPPTQGREENQYFCLSKNITKVKTKSLPPQIFSRH
jgi:hypothetical protein